MCHRVDTVPEMRFNVVQLRHVATGADYVHVDCADVNNLFRCVHACMRVVVLGAGELRVIVGCGGGGGGGARDAGSVSFRTMPTDSTGVAHVLEHTVLCGSKRYPVRDPFFNMMKRSLSWCGGRTGLHACHVAHWVACLQRCECVHFS